MVTVIDTMNTLSPLIINEAVLQILSMSNFQDEQTYMEYNKILELLQRVALHQLMKFTC